MNANIFFTSTKVIKKYIDDFILFHVMLYNFLLRLYLFKSVMEKVMPICLPKGKPGKAFLV